MQDRVVGPLSMVQFIYAVIGYGTCYAFYASLPKPFAYVIIVPLALFTTCVDFVKINERPFLQFFKSALLFAASPKQRYWQEGSGMSMKVETYHLQKEQKVVATKGIAPSDIRDFAKKSDSGSGKLIRK